jgi:hypothetical protein
VELSSSSVNLGLLLTFQSRFLNPILVPLAFANHQIDQVFLEETTHYFGSDSRVWLVLSDHIPAGLEDPETDRLAERIMFSDNPSSSQLETCGICTQFGRSTRCLSSAVIGLMRYFSLVLSSSLICLATVKRIELFF